MPRWPKWFGAGSPEPALPDGLTEGPLDVLGDGFLRDPYPIYAVLREQRPLTELASGGFLLTRHEDIAAAFTSKALGNAPSRFSALAARNRDKYTAADLAAHIPPFLDMPGHRLPRQAVSRAFHETMQGFPARLDALAAEHVAGLPDAPFDAVSACGARFALRSMAAFTGLDLAPSELKALTGAFFKLFAPVSDPEVFASVNTGLSHARAQIADAVETRRRAPADDFISALLRFQQGAPDLTDQHIIDNTLLVLADGVENIEAGLATVLWHGLRPGRLSPEADTATCAAWVREILRFDTPAQIIPRVAHEALTLHDQQITPGTPVFLALGSANRDASAVAQADRLEPLRNEAAVTFGLGRHRCIGEPLGLAQLTALTQALLKGGVRLAQPDMPPTYARRFGHRWPEALPIVLDRSAA